MCLVSLPPSPLQHKPWLAWCWLIKAVGVLGINVYFLSQWLIRQKNFEHFRTARPVSNTSFVLDRSVGVLSSLRDSDSSATFKIGKFIVSVAEQNFRRRTNLKKRNKSFLYPDEFTVA